MDGTMNALAPVRPAIGDAGLRYHELSDGRQTAIWSWWGGIHGVWKRGGETYLPEGLAELGWRYLRPVRLDGAEAPAFAPVTPGVETMRNADGRLVPAHLVPERRRLEDQTVRTLIAAAREIQTALMAFKSGAFSDIETFKDILSASCNVTLGGARGGVTLESFDATMRIEVSSANTMALGPELNVAKALIDECLTAWLAEGANDSVRTVVMDAFKVGDGGTLPVDRVLRLRQLDIRDERWQRAMVVIGDALRVARSKSYIRFYDRANAEACFQQIVLDASRV